MDQYLPLIVVCAIGAVSLGASFITFYFLNSSAVVERGGYKVGGAAAGFVVIFGVLSFFYSSVTENQCNAAIEELTTCQARTQEKQIKGTISGDNLKFLKAFLVVKTATPDDFGKFNLNASCINPEENEVGVYIVTPQSSSFYSVWDTAELANLQIKLIP